VQHGAGASIDGSAEEPAAPHPNLPEGVYPGTTVLTGVLINCPSSNHRRRPRRPAAPLRSGDPVHATLAGVGGECPGGATPRASGVSWRLHRRRVQALGDDGTDLCDRALYW
jgi:hypothetical protein